MIIGKVKGKGKSKMILKSSIEIELNIDSKTLKASKTVLEGAFKETLKSLEKPFQKQFTLLFQEMFLLKLYRNTADIKTTITIPIDESSTKEK